jgi:hydrogenase maturation protein HypF
MAAAYLDGDYDGPVRQRNRRRWAVTRQLQTQHTSSAGRLFDAVAAVLGVRDTVRYEGQAAIELEQLCVGIEPAQAPPWPIQLDDHGDTFTIDGGALVRRAATELAGGERPAMIAARFHASLARLIGLACDWIRGRHGVDTVALSGGVFQNVRLLGATLDVLEANGFRCVRHSRVPPNDGGLSLGQAVVAGSAP